MALTWLMLMVQQLKMEDPCALGQSSETPMVMSQQQQAKLPTCYPADTAEAIALENGIILAQEMNIPSIIIEFDALSIV